MKLRPLHHLQLIHSCQCISVLTGEATNTGMFEKQQTNTYKHVRNRASVAMKKTKSCSVLVSGLSQVKKTNQNHTAAFKYMHVFITFYVCKSCVAKREQQNWTGKPRIKDLICTTFVFLVVTWTSSSLIPGTRYPPRAGAPHRCSWSTSASLISS